MILLVTVFHEVGNSEDVLKEFDRILKPTGRLAIIEITKKSAFAFAPIQKPEKIRAKVEANKFKLQELKPYKAYSVFLFAKS